MPETNLPLWLTIALALVSAFGVKEIGSKLIDWYLARKSGEDERETTRVDTLSARVATLTDELMQAKEVIARLTERVEHLTEDIEASRIERARLVKLERRVVELGEETLMLRNECDRTRGVATAAINALRLHDPALADALESQLPNL